MKIGDVVQNIFLSYFQNMTVEKILENKQRVYCVWFTHDNELKRDWFTMSELKIIT